MKISRKSSIIINKILDNGIPPFLRDSKFFMYPPLKMVFKSKTKIYLDFKQNFFTMSDDQIRDLYESIGDTGLLQGETDLNQACTDKILRNVTGKTVLEAGCGRGYLAKKLSKKRKVTATDIVISDALKKENKNIKFIETAVTKLPFKDKSFDTVICTHTLEHVQDLHLAVTELRRVTKERLIIVVPKQRPYKYNFNLHVHFFPYQWNLESALFTRNAYRITDLEDWYFQEDMKGKRHDKK